MPNASRLTICPIVALAVAASGCGSTKATTTTTIQTATPKASIVAPAEGPSQTAPPGTSAKEAPHTKTERKSEPHKPKYPIILSERNSEKAKLRTQAKKTGVPVKRQYPLEAQQDFIARCTAGGGSKSSCECVITKLELSNVIEKGQTVAERKGQSLAELLAFDVALRRTSLDGILRQHTAQVPHHAFVYAQECTRAGK